MNIGIRNSEKKHLHFRDRLVYIVVLISLCIQVVHLGYSGYKFDTFSTEISEDSIDIVHQTMLDNVTNAMNQVDTLFSFSRLNGLYTYANTYLNLRDEPYVSEKLAEMENLCHEIDLKPDFVDGFFVLGKNSNQKSMYYDLTEKQLIEYSGFCQEILEESGLNKEIYQSLGVPKHFQMEDLECVLERYEKTLPEYSALKRFVEQCANHYVVSDVISDVVIIAFLDQSCFTTGLDGESNYSFTLVSANSNEIFSYGEVTEGQLVRKSEIQPEGLWLTTTFVDVGAYLRSNSIIFPFVCLLLFNIISFGLIRHFAKKTAESKRRYGKQLLIPLFVACVIPFLLLSTILNRTMNNYGDRLLKQYLDTCVLRYKNASKTFQSDCESLSLSSAGELIHQYDINNPNKNVALIRDFETSILTKVDSLPNYSYMVVTDRNYSILYQSVYSGQTNLFSDLVSKASDWDTMQETSRFWVSDDPISNGQVIVYQAPVVDGGEFIGNILISMKEPVLGSYIGLEQKNTDYVLVNKEDEILGNEQRVDSIGESVFRDFKLGSKKGEYRYGNFLIAPCNQMIFDDTQILICVDAEDYIKILDSTLYDSMVLGLIFAIVLALISWMMMWESEKRHENEKKLIESCAEAEFKMLQQQINPHFMFNTLEVINLIASVNNLDDISSITKALAEILRFSLKHSQTVTVGEEIAALKNYLLIQNIRFGDRVRIVTDLDESLFEHSMLKFVLQPLMENAISHGVYHRLTGGEVGVRLTKQENQLFFSVSDNGVGMSQEQLEKLQNSIYSKTDEYSYSSKGSGIGLKNIYRRIHFYYGEEANMLIESEQGVGTVVKLVLPIVE